MSDAVPAGWYPTPDGKQRYWDGERWTNLPYDGAVGETPTNPEAPKRGLSKKAIIAIALGFALAVTITVGGIAWKASADAQAAAELAASVQAEEDAALAAQQERDDAELAAQQERDDAERQARDDAVVDVEASVEKMATGHAADGIVDGPIINVACSPVGGGSTDDLSEKTTIFECFVANKDNGDGTMSGYYYNATMNWTSGSYTYGLGRP